MCRHRIGDIRHCEDAGIEQNSLVLQALWITAPDLTLVARGIWIAHFADGHVRFDSARNRLPQFSDVLPDSLFSRLAARFTHTVVEGKADVGHHFDQQVARLRAKRIPLRALFHAWLALFRRRLVFRGRGTVRYRRGLVFRGRGTVRYRRGLVFRGRGTVHYRRRLVFHWRGTVHSRRRFSFRGRGTVRYRRGLVFNWRGVVCRRLAHVTTAFRRDDSRAGKHSRFRCRSDRRIAVVCAGA
jgi:hypothetical protein